MRLALPLLAALSVTSEWNWKAPEQPKNLAAANVRD